MKQREVSVILATGGMGLGRAAYSAGKPAYGVGPGNAPCYIESVRRRRQGRASDIVTARASTTACSARRQTRWSSIEPSMAEVGGSSRRRAGTSCRPPRPTRWPRRWSRRSGCPIRRWSASPRPSSRRSSGSPCRGHPRAARRARRRRPRLPAVDREALPRALVLRRQGLARGLRALQANPALRRHGSHDVDPLAERAVILEFGLHKPAYRIVVNTPTTHGSIGSRPGSIRR